MAYVNVCVSSHLKEELAWAIDKQLQVISYLMFGYTTKQIKNKDVSNLKQYRMYCYVALSNIF